MTVWRNASILEPCPPRVRRGVDLVVEGGVFAASSAGAGARGGRELGGAWVMPGLVCAHNHFYSALARGMSTPIPDSSSFVQQLQNLWWRLDRALDEEILRSSGLVAAMEAVSCGTTTVLDHHASPSFISGSLSVLREAFEQVGLRGALCYEVTDRNGVAGAEEGVAENLAFVESISASLPAGGEPRRLEACIGAHAPFTLSDRTLGRLAEAVRRSGRGLHTHVAEDAYEVSHAHHLAGCDVLERLDAFGLLGPRTILAHGVHATEADVRLMNERDVFLVHNPRSNMGNAVGYARRLREVANVALGTDGIGSDMISEAAAAYFKARDAGLDLGPSDALRLLARGNEVASRLFGGSFGRIEPGYAADFVVLDYDPPTPLEAENVAAHLLFGVSSRHVRSVVIGGREVYTERRFPFDAVELCARARAEARRLWSRMAAL